MAAQLEGIQRVETKQRPGHSVSEGQGIKPSEDTRRLECIGSTLFQKEQSSRLLFVNGLDFFILRRLFCRSSVRQAYTSLAALLMAGFKTHITTSTVLGVAYGAGGHLLLGAPISTSMLAGGLCSVSGMLPDLDSDSGVPVREMTAFAAAVVPMLMMDRFSHFGWSQEMMVFVGGLIYVIIRFGVFEVFKKYTVHRGMWHSIPAAGSVGLLAFLVCSTENMTMRLFLTAAVVLGFLSHLVLDEIWSFEVKHGKLRIKRSFGTALKFWSRNRWANISVYAKLILLALLAIGDPMLMEKYGVYPARLWRFATSSDGAEGSSMLPDFFLLPDFSESGGLKSSDLFSAQPNPENEPTTEIPQASPAEVAEPPTNLVPSPVWTLRR